MLIKQDQRRFMHLTFSTLKINDGENSHLVTGLDGITYRIIEKKPDFIQFDPDQPNENTTKNNRLGHRTLKQYPYKVLVPYYTVW